MASSMSLQGRKIMPLLLYRQGTWDTKSMSSSKGNLTTGTAQDSMSRCSSEVIYVVFGV